MSDRSLGLKMLSTIRTLCRYKEVVENPSINASVLQMQQQQQQLHPPQMGPIAPGMHPHGAQMGAPPMGNGAPLAQAMGPGGQMHPNASMQPPQLQQIGQPINGTPQGSCMEGNQIFEDTLF